MSGLIFAGFSWTGESKKLQQKAAEEQVEDDLLINSTKNVRKKLVCNMHDQYSKIGRQQ